MYLGRSGLVLSLDRFDKTQKTTAQQIERLSPAQDGDEAAVGSVDTDERWLTDGIASRKHPN